MLRFIRVWQTKLNVRRFSRSLYKCGSVNSINTPIYTHNPHLISIGERFSCQKGTRLEAFQIDKEICPRIVIGNDVSINWHCHIGAINKVEINDGVLIGSNVLITDHQHGEISAKALLLPPNKRPLWSKGPVIVESNVWIGEGVSIMPGVTIGKNSIIGANSVVTKDIPANCVAAGIPAKIIKRL